MPKPILTIIPNPMVAGQRVKITGPANAVVSLDWDPLGGPGELQLNASGEVFFTCPSGTGSVLASSPGCTSAAANYGP